MCLSIRSAALTPPITSNSSPAPAAPVMASWPAWTGCGNKLRADASGDATAVIYYTGHGHVEGGAHYLIPYNVNLSDIENSAIRAEDFAARVAAMQPRRLLVILDCCHAAGMQVKAPGLPLNPAAIPAGLFMQGEKALASEAGVEKFDTLAQGSGRAVLSSSQGDQQSYMRQDSAMSIFTYHLIEALTGHAQPADGAHEVLVSDVISHVWRTAPASARKARERIGTRRRSRTIR